MKYRYYGTSILTDTVKADGAYCLWENKPNRHGRYPRHDLDSIANDMECIFSIPYRQNLINQALTENRNSGFTLPVQVYGDYTPSYLERLFLVTLKEVLVSRNIEATIKAKGTCSRRGKTAWRFSTTEYLIYAKSNGFLLKLMGLDTIEQEAWSIIINDKIGSTTPVTVG